MCGLGEVAVTVRYCLHFQSLLLYLFINHSFIPPLYGLGSVLAAGDRAMNQRGGIKNAYRPGWCGSVDWALACESKGHRFDSQSGHMPGLWARSPVEGIQEATTHWSLPLSFPSPLSKNNKYFKKMITVSLKDRFTPFSHLWNGGIRQTTLVGLACISSSSW